MEPIRVVARFKDMPEVPFLNEKRILLKNNQYVLENQEDTTFRPEELFKLYKKGSLELANPEWGIQLMQEFSEAENNSLKSPENNTKITVPNPEKIQNTDPEKEIETHPIQDVHSSESPYRLVTQQIKEEFKGASDLDTVLNDLEQGSSLNQSYPETPSKEDVLYPDIILDKNQPETGIAFQEVNLPKEIISPIESPPVYSPPMVNDIPNIIKEVPINIEPIPLILETSPPIEVQNFNINKEFAEVLSENKPSVHHYYTKQEFVKVHIGLSRTELEKIMSGYEVKTEIFDDKGMRTRRDTYIWNNPDGSYYSCDTQVGEVIQIHDNLKR